MLERLNFIIICNVSKADYYYGWWWCVFWSASSSVLFWKHLLGLVLNSCYIIIEKKKWLLMFVYVLIWGKMIDFFSCQSLLCYLWQRSDWYWKNIKDDGEFFSPAFCRSPFLLWWSEGAGKKKKANCQLRLNCWVFYWEFKRRIMVNFIFFFMSGSSSLFIKEEVTDIESYQWFVWNLKEEEIMVNKCFFYQLLQMSMFYIEISGGW